MLANIFLLPSYLLALTAYLRVVSFLGLLFPVLTILLVVAKLPNRSADGSKSLNCQFSDGYLCVPKKIK